MRRSVVERHHISVASAVHFEGPLACPKLTDVGPGIASTLALALYLTTTTTLILTLTLAITNFSSRVKEWRGTPQ